MQCARQERAAGPLSLYSGLLRATEAGARGVRLLGVGAHGLVGEHDEPQLDLFAPPSVPLALSAGG